MSLRKKLIAQTVASLIGLSVLTTATSAISAEIEISGTGSSPISGDFASVTAVATENAKRSAVMRAIEKVLGVDATKNPKVMEKFDAIFSQYSTFRISENSNPSKIGNEYKIELTLKFDDLKFRQLLLDQGVSVNNSNVRGNTILVILDEYFTSPSNIRQPLRELVSFTQNKTNLYAESDKSKSEHKEMEAVKDRDGMAKRGSMDKDVRIHDVKAKSTDNVSFKKLVEYQPTNVGADKQRNDSYNKLKDLFQQYDLKILDNGMFRSAYLGNKSMTFKDMESSPELVKYVAYARDKAKADFFTAGTTVIFNEGQVAGTGGQYSCTGVISVKTFSTVNSEDIASDTVSSQAVGTNPDDCRAQVAQKLASTIGSNISAKIQDYYKRRQMYGQEYTLTFTGVSFQMSEVLFETLRSTEGFQDIKERGLNGDKYEVVVTYKGSTPLPRALYRTIMKNPSLASMIGANFNPKIEGQSVLINLGSSAGKKR